MSPGPPAWDSSFACSPDVIRLVPEPEGPGSAPISGFFGAPEELPLNLLLDVVLAFDLSLKCGFRLSKSAISCDTRASDSSNVAFLA